MKQRMLGRVRVRGVQGADCVVRLLIDARGAAEPLVCVRRLRERRCYEMPLSWVAEAVVYHVVKAELAIGAAKAARARRRA